MKSNISGTVLEAVVRTSKGTGKSFGIVKILDGTEVLDVLVNIEHLPQYAKGVVVEDLPVNVNPRMNNGVAALGVATPQDINPAEYISLSLSLKSA